MRVFLTSYKRGLAVSLLLLFATYYIDVNCFVHSHIVNGVAIVHSHIHKSSHHTSDDGGHTVWQVNLIASIHNNFVCTESAQATDCSFSEYLIETIGCEQDCLAEQIHGVHFVWRAPPVGIFIA
ncbi:MAG: hypothetical protein MJZ79_06200 [Paludibacteraceae bacterium]|nr:hypothetical protein [Paludibacteraceae bacterium]